MIRKIVTLTLFLFIAQALRAQPGNPAGYFRPPVDFTILLSGTFGELRTNHFHSGIDIKTNGRGGEKIYAIADGYVSRIKVSAYGFGKTLYVNHPNGYVSVYAHLDRFNEQLSEYARKQHYAEESFELNVFPLKDALPVKKGEIIAYSGNSGYSFGPHLHFEIREEATQRPLNPLLFGISVKDYIRPSLTSFRVYPAFTSVLVNGKNQPLHYYLEGWGEQHRIPGNDTIRVTGPVYFGIETYDLLNDASNKNGVYSIILLNGDDTAFAFRADRFSFDESRYINSLIDYAYFIEKKDRVIRSKRDPNNSLSMFKGDRNGVVAFDDEGLYDLSYIVEDASGNVSRLDFKVLFTNGRELSKYAVSEFPANGKLFRFNQQNSFSNERMALISPEGAFYDSFYFEYDTLPATGKGLSVIHRVHRNTTPIHSNCELKIRPEVTLENGLAEKCLLVNFDEEGEMASAGGEYVDGYVVASIREFGDYMVSFDTVPPEVKPLYGNSIAGKNRLAFRIKDDLSGIRSYRGELNGKWLLMEYDAKNDLLYYDVDDRLMKGDNDFKLVVSDMKNNLTEFKTTWSK